MVRSFKTVLTLNENAIMKSLRDQCKNGVLC